MWGYIVPFDGSRQSFEECRKFAKPTDNERSLINLLGLPLPGALLFFEELWNDVRRPQPPHYILPGIRKTQFNFS